MPQVGNWVSEYCTTEGDGPLSLVGARTNRVRFNQAMPSGDTWYLVEDMETRTNEVGIGAFDGRATIVRHTPLCIFDGEGRYERSPSSPLELSGNSVVSSTMAAEMYEFLVSRVNNLEVVMPDKLEWAGNWVETVYKKNVIVNDNGWLMVSNKTTSDRAAPQISDVPSELSPNLDDATQETAQLSLQFGHITKLNTSGWFSQFKYYLPRGLLNYEYTFLIIDEDSVNKDIISSNTFFPRGYDSWEVVGVNPVALVADKNYRVVIRVVQGTSANVFQIFSSYEGISNNTGPANGRWNRSQNQNILRISKLSYGSDDYSYLLSNLIPDSIVRFSEPNDNTIFYNYKVLSITDQGTYYEYDVSLESSNSDLVVDNVSLGRCTPNGVVNIPYYVTPDRDLPDLPLVGEYSGYLRKNDVPYPGYLDKLFGLGFVFSPATISPDWDFMANSSGATGGSGGESGGGAPFSSEITETVATDGQVSFTTPEYVVGNGSLAVFINGVRQPPSAYTEVNTTTIQFSEGLIVGDLVMLEVRK